MMREKMPKDKQANPTNQAPTSSMPFVVSTTTVSAIPAQKRLGRTSKFNPLFERLKQLPENEALSFSIQKYPQIQGLRAKLEKLGFTITTRSDRDASGNVSLTAYIYHSPPESAS